MNCIKCEKQEYCSRFCREHFIKYFYKKFKAHLAKIKILGRSQEVRLKGKNKELAKHLLLSVGTGLDIKFSGQGKEIMAYSMDYKAINELEGMMAEMKPISPSVLECYGIYEIEKFCKLKKIVFEPEEYSKLGLRLKKGIDKLEIRKRNIYASSHKILEKFYEAANKKL
jgi:hypothetical protein